MTNDQMQPNRFARWADARKRLDWIRTRLEEGQTVYVCSYTRATRVAPMHLATLADLFRATKAGLSMRVGRSYVSIDGSGLRARAEGK